MMILMCIKNNDSYRRLAHGLNGHEFTRNCENVDEILEVTDEQGCNIAILDKRLIFFEEIDELLKEKEMVIYYFEGNFKDVLEPIIDKYPLNSLENKKQEQEQEELIIQREFAKREVVTEKIYVDKYTPVYAGVQNTIITVVSPFRRVGSSFISANLAAHFSKYNIFSSVVSLPDNYYFFRLVGIDKVSEKKKEEYISPHHMIDDGGLYKKTDFVYEKISFVSADPRLEEINFDEWQTDKVSKLIYHSKAPIKIIDLGSYNGIHLEEILCISDEILILIDPDPMEIMNKHDALQQYIEFAKEYNATFVLNKFANGVDNLEKLLHSKYNVMPQFDSSLIYQAIYNYKIPYKAIEYDFDKAIFAITGKYIPSELLEGTEIKVSMFKNLTNKFKR